MPPPTKKVVSFCTHTIHSAVTASAARAASASPQPVSGQASESAGQPIQIQSTSPGDEGPHSQPPGVRKTKKINKKNPIRDPTGPRKQRSIPPHYPSHSPCRLFLQHRENIVRANIHNHLPSADFRSRTTEGSR
ncbi:unnamed protein product [Tuber melanosporum]|uniref:(Perigord truffle) hypothetical protein n=1 Tax=Tuber melanosporum (strain Mel28) TaxID=656061 RepID=D5GPL7_TUBMM|nr:uncharacterized protein GSTUM_00011906001 [Tuber melanosporum]CAZ86460.1 unnamed protein product [Tuber melanosporum]